MIAATVLALPVARAEDAMRPDQVPERARQLAERGRASHNAGDYPQAIIAFKEAYVLAPTGALLFNLAQAYRLAGDCDNAAWMYRRFLATRPSADLRRLAEGHLSSVEKCGHGGLQLAHQPAMAEAKSPDSSEPNRMLVLAAMPTDEPGHREKRLGMWLAVGGGGALLAAAYFAYDAHQASNTVGALYHEGAKWQDIAPIDARGQRSATLAAGLGIGGLAAAATGGVLYAMGRHHETARHIAVAPTPHGAMVSLGWGF